jgi:cyclase
MLRKRLVTVLTFNNGVLFRTRNFLPDYRYTLNFVDSWSVDEIVVLDITRPGMGERNNLYKVVKEFVDNCFVPIAAGGGVRSIEDFKTLLRIGADKVVINTQAVRNPEIITKAAKLYGAQCVVVSIDAKKTANGSYEVFTKFGSTPTGKEVSAWAKEVQSRGAGEIMITSIDKDGSLEGYDNELSKIVSEAVDIPVLACGGAGKWQDFVDGFEKGRASAVCTTNIYHFTETSINSAKVFLKNAGIDVRL